MKQRHIQKNYALDESETDESTIQEQSFPTSLSTKKSCSLFPVKAFVEENEKEAKLPPRKLTFCPAMRSKLNAPKPKPLEMLFLPSKLRLNKKGFKDLKCNKNNKFLLDNNNYYISCPNSNEMSSEEVDEIDLYFGRKSAMKIMRKKMEIEKKNLPKILSKEAMANQVKFEDDENGIYSGKEEEFLFKVNTEGKKDKCIVTVKKQEYCSILNILESNGKITSD